MRLATFNLLHGRSLADGRVDPARLSDAVAQIGADVLALQEVDRFQPRSNGLDLTAEIASTMGAPSWRFLPTLTGTPGEDWHPLPGSAALDGDGVLPDGPSYGIGLVSRFPASSWHVVRMPHAPVRSPVLAPGTKQVVWLQDEPRAALAAVVETAVGRMTVAATHLSFVPGWNVRQLKRVCAALAELPAPQVLLGDLNLPGRVPELTSRWQALARSATYPTGRPRVQIDHALGHGSLPPVQSVLVLSLPVSDHCALAVDL